MGSHSLLQRSFLTQGSNLGLLHHRWSLHCLSSQVPHKPVYPRILKTRSHPGQPVTLPHLLISSTLHLQLQPHSPLPTRV